MADGFLNRDTWLEVSNRLSQLVTKMVELGPRKKKPVTEDEDVMVAVRTADEQVILSIVNFIEKLDSQLHKAFQSTPASSLQYLYRLRDECILLHQLDQITGLLTTHK